ncbi:MAG TPA: acyl-CoA dehydrogenase family protein [Methylomirabilota bacterium]|jgi:alkylation response protein AidB-like acyl-CoA dehydrogenase|nr:acyl-CoA dehydrogenase family protein [Methylomirabilota bacterium]
MRPDRSGSDVDYRELARMLAPKIAACADQIEQERRLPQALLDELIDAGLFRLLLPRSLDGAQVDPVTFVGVMEEISKVDASTAWVICQTSGCSMVAAHLSEDVARKLFGGQPHGILAWGPGLSSRAVPVEGGYRVTGTFSFLSGSRHATWLGGLTTVSGADGPRRGADGRPQQRWVLFPVASVTLSDVWHVIGLRGTGSDSFSVSDQFVPEEHTVSRDNESPPRDPSPLYGFPLVTMFSVGFAGVALGIARSIFDALVALARDKVPRGFKGALRENGVLQSQVAQSEARLGAARLFLMTALEEIWEAAQRSGRVTLDQRIRLRLGASHAIQQATEVVNFAYHAAGGNAVFVGSAFERRFRDMHAVTQQMQGRQDHFETVGQFLLGLEPDSSHL